MQTQGHMRIDSIKCIIFQIFLLSLNLLSKDFGILFEKCAREHTIIYPGCDITQNHIGSFPVKTNLATAKSFS